MFICAITKRVSKPRESRIPLIVETRDVMYVRNINTGQIMVCPQVEFGNLKEPWEFVSYGSEIVKEIGVTEEGLRLFHEALDKLSLESEPVES